tara:strand:- start:393 stop:1280 length:888 start_codon:yes stop_codon:yes gene_type:complete
MNSIQVEAFYRITPPRHVTIFTRMGKVLDGYFEPGVRIQNYMFTSADDILVEEQQDIVRNVECGTKDGITLIFPQIEVHNKLPKNKAHATFKRYGADYDQLTIFKNVKFFVGQICAELSAEEVYLTKYNSLDEELRKELSVYQVNMDTGIEILKVKFYKPIAKDSNILKQFQRRAEGEAERQALLAEQEKILQENQNALSEATGKEEIKTAKNTARLEREKAEAEAKAHNILTLKKAEAEGIKILAEANKMKLTPEYLEFQAINAMHNNTIYSANLPNFLGNIFHKQWGGTKTEP